MSNIRWEGVHRRYQRVVHDAAEPLAAVRGDPVASRVLLDVRRAGAFEEAKDLIAGAIWGDPARVRDWVEEIRSDQKVVVYCVAGHEMSRGTAFCF
ncbi:hypothetical protein [Variovorax sp. ZT4R33]|uniref:hypothetical protein n=1 Tax=Variovorax sp. ZT4R33 TaxID=3443743 RepID=UPI003F47EA1B